MYNYILTGFKNSRKLNASITSYTVKQLDNDDSETLKFPSLIHSIYTDSLGLRSSEISNTWQCNAIFLWITI